MTAVAKPTRHEYAAWTLAVLGTIFVLHFHLLSAVIAGLLVYELVHVIFPLLERGFSSTQQAKIAAVTLIIAVVVGAVSAAILGIVVFMRSEGGSLSALAAKMAEILESSRAALPPWASAYVPSGVDELRESVSDWLREHAAELRTMGRETGVILAHLLIGMIIGAMISMREAARGDITRPLARAIATRVARLADAFRRVVFAQVRISAINTVFTALYLAVVLPLFGVHLPLTKTMIVFTFAAGLLPVIGNLLSNTVIVVVSLAHSPAMAVASLTFLVVIHKLEYFLNARIVGGQINAKAWELLTAMLVFESAFGIGGLVAAPICYAWLKDELASRGLI